MKKTLLFLVLWFCIVSPSTAKKVTKMMHIAFHWSNCGYSVLHEKTVYKCQMNTDEIEQFGDCKIDSPIYLYADQKQCNILFPLILCSVEVDYIRRIYGYLGEVCGIDFM